MAAGGGGGLKWEGQPVGESQWWQQRGGSAEMRPFIIHAHLTRHSSSAKLVVRVALAVDFFRRSPTLGKCPVTRPRHVGFPRDRPPVATVIFFPCAGQLFDMTVRRPMGSKAGSGCFGFRFPACSISTVAWPCASLPLQD